MRTIYLTIGRFEGPKSCQKVADFSEETLIDAAEAYWQNTPNAAQMGTQVLVWDGPHNQTPHNLMAVWSNTAGLHLCG